MKKTVTSLLLFFFSIFFMFGENIRGPYGGTIVLNESGSFSQEIRLKLEDLAVIHLGDIPPEFLLAIELEVKIPNAVRKYRDSFALFFFRSVYPEPDQDITSYQGEQAAYEIIPYRSQIYYQLAVKKNVSLQVSPDTKRVSQPVRQDQLPLIITFLPVMKGIPSFLSSSEFRVRGRALLKDTGLLKLNITYPEGGPREPLNVSIDDSAIEAAGENLPLTSGIHLLTIASDAYRPVSMNFGIETGKTTDVDIILQKQVPRVFIEKPEGTIVYIDGKKIDLPAGTVLELPEGEHTVLFKLGDYSLSKKVYIEKGKDYDISLFMDIVVRDK